MMLNFIHIRPGEDAWELNAVMLMAALHFLFCDEYKVKSLTNPGNFLTGFSSMQIMYPCGNELVLRRNCGALPDLHMSRTSSRLHTNAARVSAVYVQNRGSGRIHGSLICHYRLSLLELCIYR